MGGVRFPQFVRVQADRAVAGDGRFNRSPIACLVIGSPVRWARRQSVFMSS